MKEREQDAPTTLQAIRKVAGASCSRFSECVFSQIFVRTSITSVGSLRSFDSTYHVFQEIDSENVRIFIENTHRAFGEGGMPICEAQHGLCFLRRFSSFPLHSPSYAGRRTQTQDVAAKNRVSHTVTAKVDCPTRLTSGCPLPLAPPARRPEWPPPLVARAGRCLPFCNARHRDARRAAVERTPSARGDH